MKPARVELAEANAFVQARHRHHKPVRGHRFSLGASRDDQLVGVAICGRPVARAVDQKNVLEVLRCCTDGTKNACSYLYGKAARLAKELGFKRIQTYILDEESGKSLEAAGWTRGYTTKGGNWNHGTYKGRREDQPMGPKTLYFRDLTQ